MAIITGIAAAVVILVVGLVFYLANGARVRNARLNLPAANKSTEDQKPRVAGID